MVRHHLDGFNGGDALGNSLTFIFGVDSSIDSDREGPISLHTLALHNEMEVIIIWNMNPIFKQIIHKGEEIGPLFLIKTIGRQLSGGS